jgi:hypothetical protein
MLMTKVHPIHTELYDEDIDTYDPDPTDLNLNKAHPPQGNIFLNLCEEPFELDIPYPLENHTLSKTPNTDQQTFDNIHQAIDSQKK